MHIPDPRVLSVFDTMIVTGLSESKHADIGISLPGTGETPAAPVFVESKKVATLRGADVAEQFKVMVAEYIEKRFGGGADPSETT